MVVQAHPCTAILKFIFVRPTVAMHRKAVCLYEFDGRLGLTTSNGWVEFGRAGDENAGSFAWMHRHESVSASISGVASTALGHEHEIVD